MKSVFYLVLFHLVLFRAFGRCLNGLRELQDSNMEDYTQKDLEGRLSEFSKHHADCHAYLETMSNSTIVDSVCIPVNTTYPLKERVLVWVDPALCFDPASACTGNYAENSFWTFTHTGRGCYKGDGEFHEVAAPGCFTENGERVEDYSTVCTITTSVQCEDGDGNPVPDYSTYCTLESSDGTLSYEYGLEKTECEDKTISNNTVAANWATTAEHPADDLQKEITVLENQIENLKETDSMSAQARVVADVDAKWHLDAAKKKLKAVDGVSRLEYACKAVPGLVWTSQSNRVEFEYALEKAACESHNTYTVTAIWADSSKLACDSVSGLYYHDECVQKTGATVKDTVRFGDCEQRSGETTHNVTKEECDSLAPLCKTSDSKDEFDTAVHMYRTLMTAMYTQVELELFQVETNLLFDSSDDVPASYNPFKEQRDIAFAEGAASVTAEDGISQATVDAAVEAAVEKAFAEGAASVTAEDGISQATVDAAVEAAVEKAFAEGAASVTAEDGISQTTVDAAVEAAEGKAFAAGVASVTAEDGVNQTTVDAAVKAAFADGIREGAASVTAEDGISQTTVDAAVKAAVEAAVKVAEQNAFAAGVASVTPDIQTPLRKLGSSSHNIPAYIWVIVGVGVVAVIAVIVVAATQYKGHKNNLK